MKNILKSSYMAVFALLMFSLSGCVEEFEYEGAAALRTAQVYFSQELPEQYELSNEQSSLAISLNRINADEELTVPVKITLEDNSLFGVSREVNVVFGKGKTKSTIILDYDPQRIISGKYETIVASIADEIYTTEYGLSTYTFSAGATEWEAVGTGIYTYTTYDYSGSGGIWEGSEEATLYRSNKDATLYLISPWADNEKGSGRGLFFNMDEDGNITVDGADTGWEYSSYGAVTASDLITAGIANIPSGYSDGIFYFSLAYQVEAGSLAYVEDQFQLNSPMQSPKKAKHMGQAAKIKKKLNYSLRPLLKRSYYRF